MNLKPPGAGPAKKRCSKQILLSLLVWALLSSVPISKTETHAHSSVAVSGGKVNTDGLRLEVNEFLKRELTIHLGAIKDLQPPPQRVMGALTAGEFSWATFMRALAAYADATGERQLAQRDLAKWAGQMGLIEEKNGGEVFAQFNAALALRHFGSDLKTNALWLSLNPHEQAAWRSLLNPERFYDPRTKKLINLPENQLDVAARVAGLDFELGLANNREFLDQLLDRATIQFTHGELYADDAPPAGRFDRYSNEYTRYVWDAVERAGRKDLLEKLRPSLTKQMRLWWDLVSDDGYGYNWGRQGVVSYLDTMEITGFLAAHAEFRPAPLADIAALYYQAWRSLRRDYRDDAHLLSIFSPGRGNYSDVTREREWQQTTAFFAKLANSDLALISALEREGIKSFPVAPKLPPVARFEFFRQGPRAAGVWVVRRGALRFALPITTGPKPGISDYLPSPHGLAGFAAPVEQTTPALTPYLELTDGRTIVAGDGADEVEPSADGQTLRVRWRRWAVVGKNSGDWADVGLVSEVVWRIQKNKLIRDETLTASKPVSIKHWSLAIPVSYPTVATKASSKGRTDRFSSAGGGLEVQLQNPTFPVSTSILSMGDTPMGRGVHGAIPLQLLFESDNQTFVPGKPQSFRLVLTESGRGN